MHNTHRFAKPLSQKILVLAGTGMLVLGLLALSLVLSLSRMTHVALASSNALHPFTITSPNFHDGGPLSTKQEINRFGCTGSNIAPELDWKNVPAGTKSFVMLMSDYDAPIAGGSTTGLSTIFPPGHANWRGIMPSPRERIALASSDTVALVHLPPVKPITISSCSTP